MDRRAWWATVQKVTQCQTWLRQLSTHVHTHDSHPDTSRFPGDWPSTGIKYPSPDSKPLKSQSALQPLCHSNGALQPLLSSDVHTHDDVMICKHIVKDIRHELSE